MSTIEDILTRMMSDDNFADAVFADADSALASYSLSTDELAKFKSLSKTDFLTMTAEDRKSFVTAISPIRVYFPPIG